MRIAAGLAAWSLAVAAAQAADVAAIRELIRSGRFDEAIAVCRTELRAAPYDAALLTLQGLARRGAGDPSGALASFRQALAANPRSLAALQAAAQIEYDAKDPRARQTLEAIVRLDAANRTAHAMLADLAFTAGNCAAAMPHLAQSPPTPLAGWRKGVCHYGAGRWREAAAEFAALLKLREHGPTRFNLALSYWRAGDAASTLSALAPLGDPDPAALSLRAAAQKASGDVPAALRTLQQAVSRFPEDELLLVDLAALCLDQNALDLGKRVLEAGAAAHPKSARLLTALGVFHARSGQMSEAEVRFRQAAQAAPGNGLGAVGVAMTMLQLGLASDAVRYLRADGPSAEPAAQLTLARALLQQSPAPPEDRAEAKRVLAALIARMPDNAAARSLLGKTLAQDGDTAGAIRELERALAADPSDRGSANQLLLLYRRAGRPADVARMAKIVRAAIDREKENESAAERYRLFDAGENPR